MEQIAAIKFCVKLKKTATEMLKSTYGKNVYLDQVHLNDIKCLKKGESRYETNRKAGFQLPE
jgi:hypothetical protein